MKCAIKKSLLATSTSALALALVSSPGTGLAASKTKNTSVHATARKTGTSATPSPAQTHTVARAPKRKSIDHVAALQGESMAVQGRRRSHGAVEAVGQAVIAQMVPGTNALKALATLPGISFQSPDAQGMDLWGAQVYIHGFEMRDVGVTLDDVPLGEQTNRLYNGMNAVVAMSSENISRIDVTQSAGAENAASTSNLGGTLNYVSQTPSMKRGGTVAQSFGSYNTYHTFIRFDSGALNSSGTRFYTSYMRNEQGLWKRNGTQFMQQVNGKFLQPIGKSSDITAFFNWSDVHQNNYQDLSPEMIDKVGTRVDNFGTGKAGYLAAYNAAQGRFPAAYASLSDPLDASYYDSVTNSEDKLGYIRSNFALTKNLRWTTSFYGHSEDAQTMWSTPYFPSPNGAPMSYLGKIPDIQRFGILSSLQYTLGKHHLAGGVWYENNKYSTSMGAYELPTVVNGVIQGSLKSGTSHWSHPFADLYNQIYNTNTFTGYFQDTYNPLPNLALHFGFRSVLSTTRVGSGLLNQSYYGTSDTITSGVGLTTSKPFLPHISADWRFLKNHELFFDISENVHTYAQSGYHLTNSPFAISQSAFNVLRKTIRPETAWTFAAGYRYTSPILSASVYGYRTNFNNRLQQVTSGSLINPQSTVANVGSVTMNGLDAGFTVRPYAGLSLNASVSYNHSVYDQNISNAGVTYATRGVQVVNYPRLMFKSRLSYDIEGASFYIDGSYTGTRNYDYTGDVRVPGFWMADLGASYKFEQFAQKHQNFRSLKGLTVAFNVNNLTNTTYVGAMGTNGNPMARSTGAYSYQSLEIGMPRGYYGSLKMDF